MANKRKLKCVSRTDNLATLDVFLRNMGISDDEDIDLDDDVKDKDWNVFEYRVN